MSLLAVQSVQPEPRKRTSSFCYPHQSAAFAPNPRPAKAPRLAAEMGATLRRTESYISLSDLRPVSTTPSSVPYTRTLQYYKEQRDRERRKIQTIRALEPITIRIRLDPAPRPTVHAPQPTKPTSPPPPVPRCALPTVYIPRQTSPLAPTRGPLPGRPTFPRSKPEPDLYRKALKTSMKGTPEGQKILRMGPRLAVSIMTATKELERIVAAQEQDVVMADPPVLTKSWVVVPGEDWEMVECGA